VDDLRASCVGKKAMRVLLVDDQPQVRRGLRMRLELEPDVEIAGEVGDGAAAIARATEIQPDIVLMDVEMPGMDGISATRALRAVAPHSAVVILTLYDDAATRARAKEAGASAFVGKHQVETALLGTMRHITRETQ
jgi:DNA-binding NarL/FixJ family response regulator